MPFLPLPSQQVARILLHLMPLPNQLSLQGAPTSTEATQSPQSVLDAALEKVRQSEAISFKSRTVTSVSELVSTYDTSGRLGQPTAVMEIRHDQ